MEEQKEQARERRKRTDEEAWTGEEVPEDVPETVFTGYEDLSSAATVLAIIRDGGRTEKLSAGDSATVYVDRSPFYVESGGQVSDAGKMTGEAFSADVKELFKQSGLIGHKITVTEGTLSVGDCITLHVDVQKRHNTARNHTATHLLQKALQEVLGSHVTQAGSKNDEHMLRFDFTHFEAMSREQLAQVEDLVNEKILEFLPVTTALLPIEEAKKMGAMALFSEKYGDVVRVVSCGDWSVEFCGGTHVANTGQIGAFKILSESGVASGVRRIEAITGLGILKHEREEEALIADAAEQLKTLPANLSARIASVTEQVRTMKKQIAELKQDEMGSSVDQMLAEAKEIAGVRLITKEFSGAGIAELREMSDKVKAQAKNCVLVLAAVNEGKVSMIVSVTDDLTQRFHAGKMVKEIAKAVRGGGGGKADMAQAGGSDPAGIPHAFEIAESLIK